MASHRPQIHRVGGLALLALGLLLLAHLQLKTLEPPHLVGASSSSLPPVRELPLSRPQANSRAATWRPFPDRAPELRVGLLLKQKRLQPPA